MAETKQQVHVQEGSLGLGLFCSTDAHKHAKQGWRPWSRDWWTGLSDIELASFPLSLTVSLPTVKSHSELGFAIRQLHEDGEHR